MEVISVSDKHSLMNLISQELWLLRMLFFYCSHFLDKVRKFSWSHSKWFRNIFLLDPYFLWHFINLKEIMSFIVRQVLKKVSLLCFSFVVSTSLCFYLLIALLAAPKLLLKSCRNFLLLADVIRSFLLRKYCHFNILDLHTKILIEI